jgi:hypothetical protein
MIYVDAAHEYDAVKRDLTNYYDLLSPRGLLIGDDYIYWDGVTRAVNDFAKERKIRVVGNGYKYLIAKGGVKVSVGIS